MKEHSKSLTTGDVAEFLGISYTAAYSILLYMEAVGKIQHVKSGRKNLYFLKDTYDESRLAAILSSAQSPRRHKQSKHATPVKRAADNISEKESVVHHNPNAPPGMLPALAVLGIYQTESREPQTQLQELKPVECAQKRVSTPLFITVMRNGRVKSLPKDARHLSMGDTTYLKERYLRELDGYEDVERFDCFFAEASALKRGEYGNVFYASKGTNPWEKVYKVTVERRIEH